MLLNVKLLLLLALLPLSRPILCRKRCDSNSALRSAAEHSIKQQAVSHIMRVAAAMLVPLALPLGSRAGASKGAFELDMEYYLRDLISGNSGLSSKKQAINFYPSARQLDEALARDVINGIITRNLIGLSNGTLTAEYISQNTSSEMPGALDYYRPFVPISAERLSDQYYADIYLSVLYRIAQDALPSSEQRVILRKAVGDDILSLLESRGRVRLISSTDGDDESHFTAFAVSLKRLLITLVDIGFIASFIYDEDDLFDSALEPLNQGFSLPLQVTLVRPVNMLSFLYFQKRDVLFHPDVVANVIASLASRYFDVSYDDYLLDNFYRESNFDVQAQDILLELSITKKRKGFYGS